MLAKFEKRAYAGNEHVWVGKYRNLHNISHWHMEHELLSFYKYPLMQYVLTIILSLVWISLKGIFISVWYKVWYSSYKKCGTAPACKNK